MKVLARRHVRGCIATGRQRQRIADTKGFGTLHMHALGEDRLVHNAHVISLTGPSIRELQGAKKKKPQPTT